MAYKRLINKTGHDLEATLIVRKRDHPTDTAGTVEVKLSPCTYEEYDDGSTTVVTYGNEEDIFLNGIEARLNLKGQLVTTRRVVAERGTPLDNLLNTNNTIEFFYDNNTLLLSASETDVEPPPAEQQGGDTQSEG
jgi:hypothetical protein